jgi:hypothetical protein
MSLKDKVHNERTKLIAAALNNSAVATIVTAFIAPIAGSLYGSASVTGPGWWITSVVWLLGGLTLHFAGQAVLGRLRDE